MVWRPIGATGSIGGARDFTVVKDGTVSFRISGISEDCLAQINQRLDGNDGLVADGTYRLRL
ncbi:MAG TPA: hypothetical protein GXX57_09340 [Firmicutes bacterium]|nr:hypothetical protein [Bacillota bacterium]